MSDFFALSLSVFVPERKYASLSLIERLNFSGAFRDNSFLFESAMFVEYGRLFSSVGPESLDINATGMNTLPSRLNVPDLMRDVKLRLFIGSR